jgi:hypothetical protein
MELRPWPGIVVADMGCLSAQSKQAARTGWQMAVVTKLRADMRLLPPDVNARQVECPQGQPLEWWEHEPESGQQWFRAPAGPSIVRTVGKRRVVRGTSVMRSAGMRRCLG